jgi:hypothetical protein
MASISACSGGEARPRRLCARAIAASVGCSAAGSIGALMFGPYAKASPQKQSAQFGSSRCASRNDAIAPA